MDTTKLIQRVDDLILKAGKISHIPRGSGACSYTETDRTQFYEWFSGSLSFLENVFGIQNSYCLNFSKECQPVKKDSVEKGIGILKSAKNEIENGYLDSIDKLVAAELFDGFLEMAEHLLNSGYKDPAAVLCGGVLEEHLRKLSQKNNVKIRKDDGDFKKAETLNVELAKNSVYNLLRQKQITSWLDLRNNAAHGKYEEYDANQVESMLSDVRSFMVG
ncbi:MAG: hypothetical protein WC304_01315 [Candidatus Gracilibacteria bacterium]|jgi:hypothetical protein